MYIDVSVAAGVLTQAVVNRLMATPICFAEDLTGLLAGAVVERVTFDAPSLGRVTTMLPVRLAGGTTVTITGHRVRLTVKTHIFLASASDVRSGGVAGPQNLIEISPFNIRFDLIGELQIQNGIVTAGVRTTYVDKEIAIPDPELDARVEETLAAEDDFALFDLAPIAEVLGRDLAVLNVGVAMKTDASAVVIRVEVDTFSSNPFAAWSSFFTEPPELLGGKSWAILIDKLLLTSVAESRFAQGLAQSSAFVMDGVLGPPPMIEVLEAPSALWLGGAQLPAMLMEAYVNVFGACSNGLDIGVELSVITSFSLVSGPDGTQLKTEINVIWNVIDSDALLCGIAMGLFVAPLTTVLSGGGGMSFAIGAFIGTAVSIIGVAVVGDLYEPDSGLFLTEDMEGCHPVISDEDHAEVRCLKVLDLGSNPLIGQLNADELLGHKRGLLLRGTVVVPVVTKGLSATITPLEWDRRLNCNTHNLDTTQLGSIQLLAVGTGPLTVCRTQFEENAGYFVLAPPGNYMHTHTLRIGTNFAQQDEYAVAPYPCRLMVWTSQGVRYFDLGIMPPPPAKGDPQKQIAAVLRNCLKAYDQFWKGRFNPKWRIDPPLREEVLHQWEVAVTGLREGDFLELLSRDGRTLSSVQATRAGAARAVAVVAPADGEVMIARKGGPSPKVVLDPDVHHLAITQRLLALERRLGFSGTASEIVSYRGQGRHQIAVLTDIGLHAWAERTVGAIGATLHLMDSDIRRIAALDGGIAAVRSDGVLYLRGGEDGRLHIAGQFALRNIADATVVGNAVVLLTNDRILVLDRQFRVRTEMPMEGGISLMTVMGYLAVRGGEGTRLAFFDITRQHEVLVGPVLDIPLDAHLVGGKRDLARFKAPRNTPQTAIVTNSRRVVPRRSSSSAWPELQVEPSGWLDTAVRFGPRLAQIDVDGHRMAIYRFADTFAG